MSTHVLDFAVDSSALASLSKSPHFPGPGFVLVRQTVVRCPEFPFASDAPATPLFSSRPAHKPLANPDEIEQNEELGDRDDSMYRRATLTLRLRSQQVRHSVLRRLLNNLCPCRTGVGLIFLMSRLSSRRTHISQDDLILVPTWDFERLEQANSIVQYCYSYSQTVS